MAFSRTTSRVEIAREGLAVFRTPMSKGSPMVYGLGFLLGGTSQHLLRVWFLQGQDTSLNERWKGSRCPEQQSPCRERGAASGPRGTSTRRRAFEDVWAAVRRPRVTAGDDPATDGDAIPVRPSFVSPRS